MAEFEIYEDKSGEFRWRLSAGNDIIADSGEGYSSKSGAKDAVERVQNDAGEADVLEIGTPHFELYEDKSSEWRWRMVASNGRIVADSGEGYSSKSGARKAISNVQSNAGSADVTSE